MTDDVVIAKIRKSAVSEVWVVVKTYAGRRLCDIREHFHPADGPGWLPTKKGVSFPKELVGEAVDAAQELAKKNTVADVAEIPRGRRAKTCFAIRDFRQHIYGEIRTYYKEHEDGEWQCGKGVTLPLAMLGKLAEALGLAGDQM
jgi:hypothetical protein